MRIMVTIQHPSQVQFFKHIIREMGDEGHEVHVFARDKDVTIQLLDAYDIPHRVLVEPATSIPRLVLMQAKYEYRLLREARRLQPDVLTSTGGVEISHVAPFVDARGVAFNDSEGTPANRLILPSLDAICTPRAFAGDFGDIHRYYDGYHELAYLHPNRFQPDGDRLREVGIDPDDRYFVLRFVAWNAHHDVGQRGISRAGKRDIVSHLEQRGDVYITSEDELPDEFQPYRSPVPPHDLHHLLAYADLYVGDSQTMATEAAILGTPAVRSNSFAGTGDMSNFVELEQEYELLHSFADERAALEMAKSLAADPSTKAEWQRRRERLLKDKVDVTEYVLNVLREVGEKAERERASENHTVRRRLRGTLPGRSSE